MNQRLVCIAVLAVLGLTGCTKSPSEEPSGNGQADVSNPTTTTQWIDKYMREWYLWPDELAGKTRNYDLAYEPFFESLLTRNREDGKWSDGTGRFFSYIEREEVDAPTKATRADEEGDLSLGFHFVPAQWYDGSISFVINYVVPGSDAEAQGLMRGDRIIKVDGELLSANNYLIPALKLLAPESVASIECHFYRYSATDLYGTLHTVRVTPARTIESPVLKYDKIFRGGKTIGYLAYAAFESGYPDSEDFRFNDELKAIFREFATAPAVDEVVIDLRYNSGGAVSCCRLLASMLVPAALNQTIFSKNVFNSNISKKYLNNQPEQLKFLTVPQMSDALRYGMAPGANVNMSRVYVLANRNSKSCSEMLINSLRGVGVRVILIGEQTYGKGVGMSRIDNKAPGVTDDGIYKDGATYYRYTMWPVTFTSYNAQYDGSNPEETRVPNEGFGTTYDVDEFAANCYFYGWKALGDPDEALLGAAINHSTTGKISRGTRAMDGGGIRIAVPQRMQDAGMKHVPEFLTDKQR